MSENVSLLERCSLIILLSPPQVLDNNPEFSSANALIFVLNRLIYCTAPTGRGGGLEREGDFYNTCPGPPILIILYI